MPLNKISQPNSTRCGTLGSAIPFGLALIAIIAVTSVTEAQSPDPIKPQISHTGAFQNNPDARRQFILQLRRPSQATAALTAIQLSPSYARKCLREHNLTELPFIAVFI